MMKDKEAAEKPPGMSQKAKAKKRSQRRWMVIVFLLSFFITAILSLVSGEVLDELPVWVSVIVLIFFIVLGIVFDMVGLAVATADSKQFHSMAARKLRTGKKAVWLINNAEKVSSFCNDVVGDICGIVSGATGASVAVYLFENLAGKLWLSLALTSLIAALTVGGKAAGKNIALHNSEAIVKLVARVMCGFRK